MSIWQLQLCVIDLVDWTGNCWSTLSQYPRNWNLFHFLNALSIIALHLYSNLSMGYLLLVESASWGFLYVSILCEQPTWISYVTIVTSYVNSLCEHLVWTAHVDNSCNCSKHLMWRPYVNSLCEHLVWTACVDNSCNWSKQTSYVKTLCEQLMWTSCVNSIRR